MNKIEKFKNFIRFVVSIFASREFAFIYCVIGTLSQTAHTYYLIESISSLQGFGKIIQAIGLSIFISSSLLFFTAIAPAKEVDKYGEKMYKSESDKTIHIAVNLFMVIEIIINVYYYASHLLIKVVESNIFDFIFAILVSCLIPVTIKLYAGIIQANEWFESLKTKDNKNDYEPNNNKINSESNLRTKESNNISNRTNESKNNVEKTTINQRKIVLSKNVDSIQVDMLYNNKKENESTINNKQAHPNNDIAGEFSF